MAVQVKELTKEVEKWKHKYQETKQVYNRVQRELDTVRQEKQQLQDVSDRYDRVVRVLGENVVEDAVQQDIQEQKALEEKRQMEQMPKGSIHERLACTLCNRMEGKRNGYKSLTETGIEKSWISRRCQA